MWTMFDNRGREVTVTTGADATVVNSDASYSQTVPSGDTLTLADVTYDVYVNGVLNTSGTLPAMVNNTINIS